VYRKHAIDHALDPERLGDRGVGCGLRARAVPHQLPHAPYDGDVLRLILGVETAELADAEILVDDRGALGDAGVDVRTGVNVSAALNAASASFSRESCKYSNPRFNCGPANCG